MAMPNPETIGEFAREVVRSHAQDIERMSVGEMMSGDPRFDEVTEDEFDDVEGAIYDQARTLAETLTWPDEQDADVRAVAEACADFGNDEGPRGIRQLYARFADRIAALEARDAETETAVHGLLADLGKRARDEKAKREATP